MILNFFRVCAGILWEMMQFAIYFGLIVGFGYVTSKVTVWASAGYTIAGVSKETALTAGVFTGMIIDGLVIGLACYYIAALFSRRSVEVMRGRPLADKSGK